ncbi:uncharacterized protein LOC142334246 [Lycorma delicatula]|uniref:uncharacterized protein LOC142334246 n=1 Tax=Lycorma delicatula TaxID=130591 RepID=UPI003F515E7D
MYLHAKLFVVFAAATASLAYPTLFYSAPIAPIPAVVHAPVPAVLKSQYHAQDELGQYTYGYTDGLSAKAEAKSFDGVTRGGYSYLDSNGVVQNVNYVSDAAGFRVAATNLPVAPVPAPVPLPVGPAPVEDTPEVAAAKSAHLVALKEEEAKAAAAPEEPASAPAEEPKEADSPAPQAPVAPAEPAPDAPAPAPAPAADAVEVKAAPAPAPLPLPSGLPAPAAFSVPVPIAPAPVAPVVYSAPVPAAVPAPIIAAPLTSQYHSQDELGQYSYGYIGGPSSKAEIKTFDGVTRGGYTYLDANGLVQSANYVADPLNGFRVAASNLPVAPGPVAIPDSPEVAEAKAKHFALIAKATAEAAKTPE